MEGGGGEEKKEEEEGGRMWLGWTWVTSSDKRLHGQVSIITTRVLHTITFAVLSHPPVIAVQYEL